MDCAACGAENKPDAAFCLSCGTPFPESPFAQISKGETEAREGAGEPGRQAAPPPEGTIPIPWARQEERQEAAPPPRAGTPITVPPFLQEEAPPPPAGTPITVPPFLQEEAPPPAAAETPITVPPFLQEEAPPPPAAETPAAPPAAAPPGPAPEAAVRPTVEELIAGIEKPAPTPAAEAGAPPLNVVIAPGEPAPQAPPPSRETQAAEAVLPAVTQLPEAAPPAPPPRVERYIPPEVDFEVRAEPPPPASTPPPVREEPAAAAPPAPGVESTQAMAPSAVPPAAPVPRPRIVVCPECYSTNTETNGFCQECGSPLPTSAGRAAMTARPAPAAVPAPAQPGDQRTAVLTPAADAARPHLADAEARGPRALSGRSFGVPDVLAVLAAGLAGVALALPYVLDSFTWKKGLALEPFAHQGAFAQGRADLLGGPGILPYQGTEFLTIGLLVGAGLALAVIFTLLRVGRGPMFVLAGCILLFPIVYVLFQGILPLRQSGVQIEAAVGVRAVLFGDGAVPGLGPPIWMITGAGALLVVAGFLVPPRSWGRLFSFLLFFSLIAGTAFFCAACYNWNLFIYQPEVTFNGIGPWLAAACHAPPLPLP